MGHDNRLLVRIMGHDISKFFFGWPCNLLYSSKYYTPIIVSFLLLFSSCSICDRKNVAVLALDARAHPRTGYENGYVYQD